MNNQFSSIITIGSIIAIIIIGIALIAIRRYKPKKHELSVAFYRRVITLSNTIKHCEVTSNIHLLRSCEDRIDRDQEMSEPEARVIKEMLLSDIRQTKIKIKGKPRRPRQNFLLN